MKRKNTYFAHVTKTHLQIGIARTPSERASYATDGWTWLDRAEAIRIMRDRSEPAMRVHYWIDVGYGERHTWDRFRVARCLKTGVPLDDKSGIDWIEDAAGAASDPPMAITAG